MQFLPVFADLTKKNCKTAAFKHTHRSGKATGAHYFSIRGWRLPATATVTTRCGCVQRCIKVQIWRYVIDMFNLINVYTMETSSSNTYWQLHNTATGDLQ